MGSGVGPSDSTGLGDSVGEAVAADVAGADVKAGIDAIGIDAIGIDAIGMGMGVEGLAPVAVDCAEGEDEPPAAGFDDD